MTFAPDTPGTPNSSGIPDLNAKAPATETAPATARAQASAPKRRRRVPLLITLIIVIALAIAAWFAGDAIARSLVSDTIRAEVTAQLGLPADHPVDVELDGSVLAQLIFGSLQEVRIAADGVPLGDISADVMFAAKGVPIRDTNAEMDAAAATITLDEASLQKVLAEAAGVPRGVVLLNDPELVLVTSIPLAGFPLELGIGLVPSAGEGDQAGMLVLKPNSASIGEAVLTADALRAQLGAVADTILQPINVCVADRMPVGATLSGVTVLGSGATGSIVLSVGLDGRFLMDPAMREPGTC